MSDLASGVMSRLYDEIIKQAKAYVRVDDNYKKHSHLGMGINIMNSGHLKRLQVLLNIMDDKKYNLYEVRDKARELVK